MQKKGPPLGTALIFRAKRGVSAPNHSAAGSASGWAASFAASLRVLFAMRLFTGICIWLGAAYAGGNGWGTGQALILGAAGLVVLLIGQISAIRRASA